MEDEINKLQEHVSSSIEGVVKDFKAFWRPKEAEAHLCAHKALSNKSLSADAAGEAVAACFEPSAAKETQMGEELMAFQVRVGMISGPVWARGLNQLSRFHQTYFAHWFLPPSRRCSKACAHAIRQHSQP